MPEPLPAPSIPICQMPSPLPHTGSRTLTNYMYLKHCVCASCPLLRCSRLLSCKCLLRRRRSLKLLRCCYTLTMAAHARSRCPRISHQLPLQAEPQPGCRSAAPTSLQAAWSLDKWVNVRCSSSFSCSTSLRRSILKRTVSSASTPFEGAQHHAQ